MSAAIMQMLAGSSSADITPPTITSASTDSVAGGLTLAHALTASETVTWSIVGGADQAQFDISGSTLRWLANGTENFASPADADTNNTYIVTVRATDLASNTTDQTITVTVTSPPATWDAGTVTAVTLSNGNLTATNTGTTSADQGAHVATSSGKTSGKYYFEVTWSTWNAGGNGGFGIGTTASTYTGLGNNATTGNIMFKSGNFWANGTNFTALGARSSGDVIGCAIDLDNRTAWVKKVNGTPTGWNQSSGSNDPATNTGGKTIPSGIMVPFVVFGGSGGVAGSVATANFGASAFTGSVPSGFTAGWPQ